MGASTLASAAAPTCGPITATVRATRTVAGAAPPSTGSRSKGEEHRMTINKKTIVAAVGAADRAGVATAMGVADCSPRGGRGRTGGATDHAQGEHKGGEQGYHHSKDSSVQS